jgi:hypothetical protein
MPWEFLDVRTVLFDRLTRPLQFFHQQTSVASVAYTSPVQYDDPLCDTFRKRSKYKTAGHGGAQEGALRALQCSLWGGLLGTVQCAAGTLYMETCRRFKLDVAATHWKIPLPLRET